ncbi:MAG: DUF935 family protein [Methylomarinum sp.]|nr:DUF935 family protein [Methylomarinum sp.]
MDSLKNLAKRAKNFLSKQIATRTNDPDFYGALSYLPNPDEILRKLGMSHKVYDAIQQDAHVIGELKSIKAGLLGYEWRLQAGGDSAIDKQALEFCQDIFKRPPDEDVLWEDIIWNMYNAVLKGFQVHEVVWRREGDHYIPDKIIDIPQRRFVFSTENKLRLLTKDNRVEGEELGPRKWLLSRHMPSADNPYGIAVFSSCFWPYTFKHSGFKYFVKFCEKYGIPWAIGKYPQGTPTDQQDALADALANMVEDGVAAIPDDGSVELLQTSVSGELVQERLINTCNGEMSKALTSQTLSTEINGNGSRAAAETHKEKQNEVSSSERLIVEATMNTLMRWTTEINFAGAEPPTFSFFEEAEARKEWVEVIEGARKFLKVPTRFAHERLNIPEAKDGEEVLPGIDQQQSPAAQFSHNCPTCHDYAAKAEPDTVDKLIDQASSEADKIIEANIDDIAGVLDHYIKIGLSLDDFVLRLETMYPAIDKDKLQQLSHEAMATTALAGMDEA